MWPGVGTWYQSAARIEKSFHGDTIPLYNADSFDSTHNSWVFNGQVGEIGGKFDIWSHFLMQFLMYYCEITTLAAAFTGSTTGGTFPAKGAPACSCNHNVIKIFQRILVSRPRLRWVFIFYWRIFHLLLKIAACSCQCIGAHPGLDTAALETRAVDGC